MKQRKVTSYQDLIKRYKKIVVELTSGDVYEVRRIQPGEYMLAAGSPLIKTFTERGVDITNKTAILDAVSDMSTEEQLTLITNSDFVDLMKNMVIHGVTSVNFVDKSIEECDESKKEVPLSLITANDLFELYTVIANISAPDAEVMDFYSFREGVTEMAESDNTVTLNG